MNAESWIADTARTSQNCRNPELLKRSLGVFEAFAEERAGLDAALGNLEEVGDASTAKLAGRLRTQLEALEPSVTMIGQVKAGKTSLVNAMIGWPSLLPADVNPWTSVVTSLHLDPQAPGPDDTRAAFRFFDHSEWDRLLDKGGRIGELAERAGHNDELEKVRAQVEHMREKSRSRLGRRFELLLGQQHDYGSFDEELIERYVCLGDDFDDEDSGPESQGRFADITKSADLFLHRPEFPMKLCIRDTPGVNDTFMMREQITIRAIRDSRICVVVLSAQQALSSVDMALIRLISNIRSREVVIFVNRIDELPNPGDQIEEIRDSIRATLKKHDGPVDAEVIFGSAHWANAALMDMAESLDTDSKSALLSYAEHKGMNGADVEDPLPVLWDLSGLNDLYRALATRISEGPGRETLSRAAKSAVNLAKGLQATAPTDGASRSNARLSIPKDHLIRELDRIGSWALAEFDTGFDGLLASYAERLDRSHRSFLERATASLISHLDKHGEKEVWKYEPTGLRLLLRSAYQVFGAKVQSLSKSVSEAVAAELSELFQRAFEVSGDGFSISAPGAVHIPPPVLLGQTIALDIQGNWWSNWWRRRRGYQAFATEFYTMIEGETSPILRDLKITQTDAVRAEARKALRGFLDEQSDMILGLAERQATAPAPDDVLVLTAVDQQRSTVADTIAALDHYAA